MAPAASQLVPCLPENAPFTPEQRAYLNGFLAGLFSRAPVESASASAAAPAPPLVPLSILYGSQTGNAEGLARRAAKAAAQRGFAPTIHDLAKYPTAQLASEERLLFITSTYGDGEPPDNAKAFWKFLDAPHAPKFPRLQFAVCALGDTNYPKFCAFGKALDARLETLGALRAQPCAVCDVDFDEPFAKWLDPALSNLVPAGTVAADMNPVAADPSSVAELRRVDVRRQVASVPELGLATIDNAPSYSRARPFPATLLVNHRLNAPGSEKDTRHLEFALEDSGLAYEAGDALGIFPTNCDELAQELLAALHCSGDKLVPGRNGDKVSMREALSAQYEVTRIPRRLLEVMAEKTGDANLKRVAAPDANGELTAFLREREIIDLLLAHPSARFAPAEFVGLLRPLAPRLYSISSSPKAHPGRVHLTVNVVRYEALSRRRKGVCSTYLAERVAPPRPVPLFVQSNPNFRPPADDSAPMIMVGSGTGIAPFRAFLHERRVRGASGRNWLFFGDQRASTDFLYREELESLRQEGVLARLDTAFSRDQSEKVYVQHRMREHARELFAWLEAGAYFYVCGDANRMAKDVDAALHEVIQLAGNRTPEQAADYVTRLQEQKRYLRDVY